jgi:hypothetical protein
LFHPFILTLIAPDALTTIHEGSFCPRITRINAKKSRAVARLLMTKRDFLPANYANKPEKVALAFGGLSLLEFFLLGLHGGSQFFENI